MMELGELYSESNIKESEFVETQCNRPKIDLEFEAKNLSKMMPRQFLKATLSFLQYLFCFLPFSLPQTLAFAANSEVIVLFSWLNSSISPPSALSSWNPHDSNPCKWSYITCSRGGYVTEINVQSVHLALPFPSNLSSLKFLETVTISDANLTGTIPFDLGDCTSLNKIDVSSNSLVGNIPPSIGKLKYLQELILNSNQLTGMIPGELGGCTSLKSLELFDNRLSGKIPVDLGKLSRLEIFRAGGNQDITGKIPDEIGNCQNLQVLGLADTEISGKIPSSLGKLKKLQTLSLYTTMLSGAIPGEIGNCSELVDLYLYENNLSGSLPLELGKLQNLEKLLLWQNNFVGPIPGEIGNSRSLVILDVSLNFLSGVIPESFGNLTNLEELMLSSNNISGSIPASLSNATSLIQFQIDSNQISGSIPAVLGSLTQLQVFFAWDNKLDGSIPPSLSGCVSLQALDLSHNSLTGSLPPSIFQLSNLTKLLLIFNNILGTIPPEIGDCKSLVRLRLDGNKLNGEIPKEFGFLANLSFLDISSNHLSGLLPDEIGNCEELQMLNLAGNLLIGNLPSSLPLLRKLEVLDVSMNQFEGSIPERLGELSSLNRLSLASNFFSGPIPQELGSCSRLQLLDLSRNQLSGSIPIQIFEIQALEIALNLSWNSLTGEIPPHIFSLNKLSVLDLSHNKLQGDLTSISELQNLVVLNISYNNFSGYLPDNKLFRQLSAAELEGNQGLCPLGYGSCFLSSSQGIRTRPDRKSWKLKLGIAMLALVTVTLGILGILAVMKVRRIRKEDIDYELGENLPSSSWKFTPFQKLSFSVEQILRSLDESNAIGRGCSGIVYRAELDSGEVIAVKKLWPTSQAPYGCPNESHLSRDSFSTEVRTLGSIRHKNIVKFLGYCSNQNTRLLMYDYMPNGSLGSLLHERDEGCLEWDVRYKIILGSAEGLAYLHHDCVPPIVHRDIKANNILIGPDFEPYIADFGLAKLVKDGDFTRSSNTVAGSYGYIAPEYGYMLKITEKSDVYSYGVVVLELLTGKQPIDPTIPDGLHIVDWVRRNRAGTHVLDSGLRCGPEPEIQEMMQTLGVAMLCVNTSPEDRPSMKDVAAMLKEIRLEREENSKTSAEKGRHPNKSNNSSFPADSAMQEDSEKQKDGIITN